MAITDKNVELSDWLVEHRELVTDAFSTGTIRRVTKAEKKKLHAALEAIVAADNKDFAFIADNHEAMEETFRWPTVKRMDEHEKMQAAQTTIQEASNNPDLAAWSVENKEGILKAFEAGKVKRTVSPKAQEALAKYREELKEKKAQEAAAAEATPEAAA